MIRLLLSIIASHSPEKWKVGAIYVQGFRWSTGYNKSRAYGDHAEDWAVINFRRKYGVEPKNGTMYCTWSPCTNCAKTLEKHVMKSWYVERYTGKL